MQQINFLKELHKPQKPILPGSMLLQIVIGFCCLLLIITIYGYLANWDDNRRLTKANITKLKVEAALKVLHKDLPQVTSPEMLLANIQSIQLEIEEKQQALKKFTRASQLRGFADYLRAFSEYTPAGIWLEHIVIDAEKNQVILEGNSIAAASIPEFLDTLADTEFFEHSSFQVFQLKNIPDKPYIHFTLGSLELELKPGELNE